MTFATRDINLGGTTFTITNGAISPVLIDGNNKQWSGSRWIPLSAPGKPTIRQIRISGRLEGQDAAKTSIEALRDSGTYAYNDGLHSLTVVVMDVNIGYNFGPRGGFQQWDVDIILEEYDQV